MSGRHRWLDWRPASPSILEICLKGGPTKPTKLGFVGFVGPYQEQAPKIDGGVDPGFVGFVGPCQGQGPKIEEEPDPAELSRASAILGLAGVRLMRLETGDVIGVWSDLDSPAIRSALRTLGVSHLPVRYLDGPGIPDRYKLRRVPGDPVPDLVRREMELSREPWRVRNKRPCNFAPWPFTDAQPCASDPRTGIRPIAGWGPSCGRGLAASVTNRKVTRKRRTVR